MSVRAEPAGASAPEPAAASATGTVLITIPISHYCEKARWALDRAGIGYRERAHLQLIHRIAARRAGGGTAAPRPICAEGGLSESAAILAYPDPQAPAASRTYPADATS